MSDPTLLFAQFIYIYRHRVPDYCKILIFGSYLILVILAVKAKSGLILRRFHAYTNAQHNEGSDKKGVFDEYFTFF